MIAEWARCWRHCRCCPHHSWLAGCCVHGLGCHLVKAAAGSGGRASQPTSNDFSPSPTGTTTHARPNSILLAFLVELQHRVLIMVFGEAIIKKNPLQHSFTVLQSKHFKRFNFYNISKRIGDVIFLGSHGGVRQEHNN